MRLTISQSFVHGSLLSSIWEPHVEKTIIPYNGIEISVILIGRLGRLLHVF